MVTSFQFSDSTKLYFRMGCVGYHTKEIQIPWLENVKVYCNRTGKKNRVKVPIVILENSSGDSGCWISCEKKSWIGEKQLTIQRKDIKSSGLSRVIQGKLEEVNKQKIGQIQIECPSGLQKKERGWLFKALSKALIQFDSKNFGVNAYLQEVYLTWDESELSELSLHYRDELLALGILLSE